MSTILDLALDLLQNLMLAFALALVYGLLARRTMGQPWTHGLAIGASFGLATVACMLLPVALSPGVIWDGRLVTVATAGVFGGPLGAAVAAGAGAAYRLWLGGSGAPAGVLSLFLAALAGGWLGWQRKRSGQGLSAWHLLGLGSVLVVIGLGTIAMIPEVGLELVRRLWAPLLLVMPLVTLLLGLLLLDQTNYARALAQLEAEQRRFRAIFDSQFQFIGLMRPDGTLIEANRTALEFGGLEPEDVLGKPFWEARWWTISPATQERLKEAIAGAASGSFERYEVEVRGAGERTAVIDFSLKPILDEQGRVVLLVPEGRDVTALREAQARAQEAQRMQAVGRLTGGVAHEFNNLLQVIIGSCELLRGRIAVDTAAEQHGERILKAAQRGAQLTQRLLAFSGKQPLRPQDVELGGALAESAELARSALPAGVTLEIAAVQRPIAAFVDGAQLQHALLNLILNARDALPAGGGRIALAASLRSLAGDEASALGVAPGHYATLQVRDDGSGMTEEVKALAFEPFFTTKDVGQGSGLGLSMVLGFVRQSGGTALLESEAGKGTCVTLFLPLAAVPQPCDAVPEAGMEAQAEPDARPAVLLVEDDPEVLETASLLLRHLGCRVTAVGDAPAALAVLGSAARIDLLFTDLVLPGGMNGLKLANEARQLRPGLAIAFATGYSEAAADAEAVLQQGQRLLRKPFDRKALNGLLEQTVLRSQDRELS